MIWAETCKTQLFTEQEFPVCSFWCVCVWSFPFSYLLGHQWVSPAHWPLLWFDRLLCSVVWSRVLNNIWDILLRNYYGQNTSWLSVSNNVFDHEISGSGYDPERQSFTGVTPVWVAMSECREAQLNFPEMIGKPGGWGEWVWGPPGMTVGTICTIRSPCWTDRVLPTRFEQHP